MKNTITWFIVLCMIGLTVSGCASKQKRIKMSQDNRRVAEAYMAKGDYTEALRYLLDAQTFHANDHLLQDDLGKVYVARGKYDLAITHFKRALEIEPDFAPGMNNLGAAYLLSEQWDEAIAVFTSLNDNLLYATPHYPLYNLGWAYYNKGEYKTAISYFNKSLKSQHGFILALRGLGLTYQKRGDLDRAIGYFKKATEKNPRFAELYFDLGTAYAEKKQDPAAIEAFEKVSLIQPNTQLSDKAKEEIRRLNNRAQ